MVVHNTISLRLKLELATKEDLRIVQDLFGALIDNKLAMFAWR